MQGPIFRDFITTFNDHLIANSNLKDDKPHILITTSHSLGDRVRHRKYYPSVLADMAVSPRDSVLGRMFVRHLQAQLHHGLTLTLSMNWYPRFGCPSFSVQNLNLHSRMRSFSPRHDTGHQQAKWQSDQAEGAII